MAWFRYKCADHGEFTISLKKREKTHKCKQCELQCNAILNIGTARVVEQLDSGTMARKVERLHNVEEIMEERNAKYSPKPDDETD